MRYLTVAFAIVSFMIVAIAAYTPQPQNGWATYIDTTHKELTPFTILEGVTDTLENTADSAIVSQMPLGTSNFYNKVTKKITPVGVGDAYILNVRFKAKNTNVSGYFTIYMTINGVGSEVFGATQSFRKGANTEQYFNFAIPVYSLNTFVTNGGLIRITADQGDLSIYGINYFIQRTHKAR